MMKYLGIKAPNYATGVMQDIHWSMGLVGYFPTYALGTAFAGQIHHAMKKDLDIDQLVKDNNIKAINAWMKEKIHQFGALKLPLEIIKDATGEDFTASYYVAYLKEKYSNIYK